MFVHVDHNATGTGSANNVVVVATVYSTAAANVPDEDEPEEQTRKPELVPHALMRVQYPPLAGPVREGAGASAHDESASYW